MKFLYLILILFGTVHMHTMDEHSKHSHNTYQGQLITHESLIQLTPKMSRDLEEQTDALMVEYQDFITQLVTTPHPLTHENRAQKSKDNIALIQTYKEQEKLQSLSNFNYV